MRRKDFPSVNATKLNLYLVNPVVQDFLAVLIAFKILDKNKSLLKRRISDLNQFLRRCRKHASYYRQSSKLRAVFRFIFMFVKEYEKSLFIDDFT